MKAKTIQNFNVLKLVSKIIMWTAADLNYFTFCRSQFTLLPDHEKSS